MKIGFVSRGNAIRSIFAEAIMRQLSRALTLKVDIYSAGVQPEKEIDPLTLETLRIKGMQAEGLFPKGIDRIPYRELDILVTIGEEAKEGCEFVESHKRREVWLIDEPPRSPEAFRRTYESVEANLKELLKL